MIIALEVSNGPTTTTVAAAAVEAALAAAAQSTTTSHTASLKQSRTPRKYPALPLSRTLASLPRPADVAGEGGAVEQVRAKVPDISTPMLVILDDDPMGTQTSHEISVCLTWDHSTLVSEFKSFPRGFFILTNSRALPPTQAKRLVSEIVQSVRKAAEEAGRKFELVLRGDSTLRGHFPEELYAAEELIMGNGSGIDAWILAPFFSHGGRYTIDDVHYVAEKNVRIPAAETPFAEDASFGYRSSNLRDYILEKAPGRYASREDLKIVSISISDIRLGGVEQVRQSLLEAKKDSVIIVNAAAEEDMQVFAAGVIAAEEHGKRFLFRTAASFVSARLGIPPIPFLKLIDMDSVGTSNGGLIIAGSYVPKTTAQLSRLVSRRGRQLHVVESPVTSLLSSLPR